MTTFENTLFALAPLSIEGCVILEMFDSALCHLLDSAGARTPGGPILVFSGGALFTHFHGCQPFILILSNDLTLSFCLHFLTRKAECCQLNSWGWYLKAEGCMQKIVNWRLQAVSKCFFYRWNNSEIVVQYHSLKAESLLSICPWMINFEPVEKCSQARKWKKQIN